MYNFYMRKNFLIILLLLLVLILCWKVGIIIDSIFCLLLILTKIVKKEETNEVINEESNREINERASLVNTSMLYDEYVEKGKEAEIKIVNILKRIFKEENIIHDSYFRDDELVTTQIDVIAISKKGIYIIESKDYSGIIKGKIKEKYWVQLFRNKRYTKFLNPVKQNERHVNAIKNNLKSYNIDNKAFKSYIVFGNKCKLDIEVTEDVKIIKQEALFYTMLQEINNSKDYLTDDEVNLISKKFKGHSNISDTEKIKHIIRRKNNITYGKE